MTRSYLPGFRLPNTHRYPAALTATALNFRLIDFGLGIHLLDEVAVLVPALDRTHESHLFAPLDLDGQLGGLDRRGTIHATIKISEYARSRETAACCFPSMCSSRSA